MIHTIRVKTKDKNDDLLGDSVFEDIKKIPEGKGITDATFVKVYRLEGVSEKQAKTLAEKLFFEEINQIYSINKPIEIASSSSASRNDKPFIVEIGYQPGVMNPEVGSIVKVSEDLGIQLLAADVSREYIFSGHLTKKEIKGLIEKLRLFNPLIEHIVEQSPKTLIISGRSGKIMHIPILSMNDDQLIHLSKDKLFLNLEEMKIIQSYFQKLKRNPTDCELETLAQTWSEHCAHKTFKARLIVDGREKLPLIKRIKDEAWKHKKYIVSAFEDNSGVMDFYEGYAICGKAETHNSPSAIEPYGGAMTGSGGVFRDVVGTGRGAKPIASTDIFCFAPPHMDMKKLPDGCLPPDYMLKRCVAAVRDYGNRVGIPTNNGSFHFHDDFRAKPTVLVGAYGIMPKKYAQKGKPKPRDVIVALGGKTGRDGIHGATFSSGEMTDKTISVNSTAVQIGNAIEEKRVFDAILEASAQNLIRAMTDCGAGGFSSAIGEMGEHRGVEVHLENAPLKYTGLSPWEIWISESQERMMLAVPKNKLKQLLAICKKHNTETAVLGKFTDTKRLVVKYNKETVCDLDMQFLHKGLPQRTMVAKRITNYELRIKEKKIKEPTNGKEWIKTIKKILAHPNICSKEPIVRLYDHTVQGTNVIPPYSGETMHGPNDSGVVRPLLGKPYGMIISHGLSPVLTRMDPYLGSIWAATEALSNYAAVGGDVKTASLINNYIWPFPDEESLWTLDRSVDAVVDFMKALKIPVISGKDSLSSTYRGKNNEVIRIPPVLCISAFGKIADVSKTINTSIKKSSSLLYLIGFQDLSAMGGSVYFETAGIVGERVPNIDLKIFAKTLDALHKGIQQQTILSAHDISEGGALTAIFEMCVGGNLGANITLSAKSTVDTFLFNETAGSFIVEVENKETAEKLFKDIPHTFLGTTKKEKSIQVISNKKKVFDVSLEKLQNAWEEPMKEYFR